jgi:O-antigen/teichoic acid export membrane protein
MTSIGSRIVSSAVWTAIETWGQQAILFGVFVLIARLLGPNAVGLAALALMAPAILTVPVTKGLPDAIIQRREIEPEHLDSVFWLLVLAGATLSILVWATASLIAAAFSQPVLAELIRWTCFIITIQALAAVPAAILKRELNFRLLALRTLVGTAIGGSLGIGLAVMGFGVWSLVWMQITKLAVEVIVLYLGGSWRPRLRYSHSHSRSLFGFALPIVGFSVWTYVNDEIPKMILGTFLGPGAVGVYAFARRPLDLLVGVFVNPLASVAMPAVSRLQDDRTKIDRFFNTAVRVAGLVGFPAFIGLAAIAPEAVPLLLGDRWESGVVAIQIIMLLGLLRTIDTVCGGTVLALGHSVLILKLNIAYTVIAVILLVMAAQISLEATMAALVASNLALVPVFLYFTQRIANINVMKPLFILPRLATSTALMFVSVTIWRLAAAQHLTDGLVVLWGIIIGAVVYGAAAIGFMRPDLLTARDMLLKMRE